MSFEDMARSLWRREVRQVAAEVLAERDTTATAPPAAPPSPPKPTPRTAGKGPQARGNAPRTPAQAPRAPKAAPQPPQAPRPGVRVHIEPVPDGPQVPIYPAPSPKTSERDTTGPSPCAVCGGGAEPGSPTFGPFRLHPGCEPLLGDPAGRLVAAARVLGLGEVARIDARLLTFEVPRFEVTHREPTWDRSEPTRVRLPWRHISRKDLAAAVDRLPDLRVEAGLVACTCSTGPCGWCGAAEATGWVDAGQQWANGDPAPLCGACHIVFVRYSEPSFPEDVRAAISEAVTGAPMQSGETPPHGLVPYASTAGDDRPGSVEPWAHLNPDALRNYRFTTWSRFGFRYCPPERREAVQAWAAERDAERTERDAAQEAADAHRQDVHGFSGGG